MLKKIKIFFGILKIRGGILLYSKNFFPPSFQKLGAGGGGQPNNLFLALLSRPTSLIVTLTVASSLLCFCMVVARKKSTTSVFNFVNVLKLNTNQELTKN